MGSRAWAFTLQLDEQPEDLSWLTRELPARLPKLKYLVYQLEVAPSTGKLHVQGAARFSATTRMAAILQGLDPMKPHLEPARNWNLLKTYCQKEDTRVPGTTYHEWGRDDGQGARTDLAAVCSRLKDGATLLDVATEAPEQYVRLHKGLHALWSQLHPPRAIDRRVALFWGDTATGKTRMVFDHHPTAYTVFCIKTPWFDGYAGQQTVLFDECGPGMMNHNFLKRLLDRYPMTVPVKGGSVSWLAETIVLTSNVDIREWFAGSNIHGADFDALKRRMRIFKFPEEKWLAECWIRGGHHLQEPVPRPRSPSMARTTVNVESDTEPDMQMPPTDLFDLVRSEETVLYSQ
uniref:Replication-associated protein n=1 Tax=Red panda circovirus 4 TaxID=2863953 RepID=A0A8K1M4E0_9CIRC|nr:putative replication-associated protein [Red panda circovirus 4]